MKKKVISLVTMGMMGAALLAPGGALAAQHQSFRDIKGHFAQKHIEAMAEKGIVSGTGMGKFSPDQKITKEHVEALLKKASGKEVKLSVNHRVAVAAAVVYAFDLTPEADKLTDADIQAAVGNFTDKDMIPAEDVKQVAYVIKEGVLSGVSATEFKPHDEITRGQVVTILGRLDNKGKITLKTNMGGMTDKQGKMTEDQKAMMEAKKAEMVAMMADMQALFEQLKKDGKLTPEQLKLVEDMQKKMAEHQAMMDQKMKDMAGMDMAGMGQGTSHEQHQQAAATKQVQKMATQPAGHDPQHTQG
ncbi:MAG: S-layer homology domain-containing protein [Clostridia bacterium]|nr:S-layer homology domain-containing protein [Clostridia bacterium]